MTKAKPDTPILHVLIHGSVIRNDSILADLLRECDEKNDVTLYIPNFYKQTIEYIGPSIISVVGVSASELYSGGLPKLFGLTLPADIANLNARQSMYMQEIHHSSFKLSDFVLQEFHWTTIWPDGSEVQVLGIGVVLSFTKNKEFELGVGFLMREEQQSHTVLEECKALLKQIKERHNVIYDHSLYEKFAIPFVKQFSDKQYLNLSICELEVLKCLALGSSTKEIVTQLSISTYMVETCRKNLLEKFDAKNSAELIKKASKVFWLE